MTDEAFFRLVVARPEPDRAAVLDQLCGEDQALRRRLEARLRAAAGALPIDTASTPPQGPVLGAEAVGSWIGPYKLLQKLGEGGMGAVWVAEQQTPVKRRVALKLVKPGMDSAQVLRRFEQERQALALMDHDHIARVFDAGTTPAGRPYFVMELVKGVPIVKYCDELHLSLRERLALFVPVCRAIQHAHTKGIIHRDIKPSNVLVALQDGKPIAKVIDFGVAKALHRSLTDQSLYTEIGQVVGTLEYMAPEQAELSALDVDTRADIYALGVLLYELLTGTTPLEAQRLRSAALNEALRLIREVDPPRPSTRLSHSGQSLADLALRRRTAPAQLTRAVRGELDWIVMKTLEKDRTRRYETANGLARDLERYLNDEPVEACPPSQWYRVRKLLRRHRGGVVTAAAFVLVLLAGTVVSTWLAVRATVAEGQATEAAEAERAAADDARQAGALARARLQQIEKANAVLTAIFHDLDPDEEEKGGAGLREQLGEQLRNAAAQLDRDTVGDPVAVARLQIELGKTLSSLGHRPHALQLLETAHATCSACLGADHPDTLMALHHRATVTWSVGRHDEATALLEQVLARRQARLGGDHADTLMTQAALAYAYREAWRLDKALPMHEHVHARRQATLGADHRDTFNSVIDLARTYEFAGQPERAYALCEQALPRVQAKLGPEHPTTAGVMTALANAAFAAANVDRVLPLYEQALAKLQLKLGPDHPGTLTALGNLGTAYYAAGRVDRALPLLERALQRRTARQGTDHPLTVDSRVRLATAYRELTLYDKALPLYEQALTSLRAHPGAEARETFYALHELGLAYAGAQQFERAITLFKDLVARRQAKLGADHPDTLNTQLALANTYRDALKTDQALVIQEPAVAKIEARLGPDHPTTLSALDGLARSYQQLRQFDKALPLFERVLARRRSQLGADHRLTLASHYALGILHMSAGRRDQAVAMLEDNLARRRATLGSEHLDTLRTLSLLALTYLTIGQRDKALPLLEEALPQQRARLGASHPDTLVTLNALALSYTALRQLDKAIPLAQEALAASEGKYGSDNVLMLGSMVCLGAAYRVAKQYDKAANVFQQAAERGRTKVGATDPLTLSALQMLAETYREANQLDKALPLFEQVLAGRRERLGPDHADTLATITALAQAYQTAGQPAKAVPLFEEIATRRQAKLGPDHADTLTSRRELAVAYLRAKRGAEALKLHEAVLAARQAKLGPKHAATLMSMWDVADSLLRLGRGKEAVAVIDACVEVAKDQQQDARIVPGVLDLRLQHFRKLRDGAGCRETAEHWEKLGRTDADSLYRAARLRAVAATVLHAADQSADGTRQANAEAERAADWLRQAIAARPNDADPIRGGLYELAGTYLDLERPQQALPLFTDLLARERRRLGDGDPRFASQLATVGARLVQGRQFAEAEKLLRECVAIREKAEPAPWRVANARSLLGAALLGQKKYADAEPLLWTGYRGLKDQEAKLPAASKRWLTAAEGWLAELCEATRSKTEARLHGALTAAKTQAVHERKLTAGKLVVIELRSTQFDPLLRLEDAAGKLLAENDDVNLAANDLNSRVLLVPREDGVCRIRAGSYQERGRGAYELIIREYAEKPK